MSNSLNTDFGRYEYNKFFLYDPMERHQFGVLSTKYHEIVHFILTGTTTFGLALSIIDKMAYETEEKKIPLKKIAFTLENAHRYTQEGAAVYFQLGMIKVENGKNAYDNAVNSLKQENREYFKYVEPLLPILDNESWEVIFQNGDVLKIAQLSMRIDMTRIGAGVITSPGKLNRYFNREEMIYEFRPDSRFKKMIKAYISLISNERNVTITPEYVATIVGINYVGMEIESQVKQVEWLCSQFTTDSTADILEHALEETRNLVEPSMEEIKRRTLLAAHPMPLNPRFDHEIFQAAELMSLKRRIVAIGTQVVERHFHVGLIDIFEGKIYENSMSKNQFLLSTREINAPILFFHENYTENQFLVDGMDFLNQKVFVYIDVPYVGGEIFIKEHCSSKKECFIMKFNDDLYYMYVKMKNGMTMIQPLSPDAVIYIEMELERHEYQYINVKDGFCIDGIFCMNKDDYWIYRNISCALSYSKYSEMCKNSYAWRCNLGPNGKLYPCI